jgi:hypothetical protein
VIFAILSADFAQVPGHPLAAGGGQEAQTFLWRRGFKQQLERFVEVIPSLFNGVTLAGDVELGHKKRWSPSR